MASNSTKPAGRPLASDGGSDILVLISMALVVAAVVVGLNLQVGLSLTLAGMFGMALFVGLAGFHAAQRASGERDALSRELARLEKEVNRLKGPSGPAASAVPAPVVASHRMTAADGTPGPVLARPAEDIVPENVSEPAVAEDARGEAGSASSPVAAAAPASSPGARPATGALAIDAEAARIADAVEAEQPISSVREDDVEMLQRRIKEMLYQVTAAEQARELAAGQSEEQRRAAESAEGAPVAALGIEASLEALRAASHSMRIRPQAQAPNTAGTSPAPSAGPPSLTGPVAAAADPVPGFDDMESPPADSELVAIREAIAAGRVDVFLEPILALGNQSAQHYEVSIKLRGASCEDLGSGDDGRTLPGKGLLPLFDSARIARSAIVAERLASRGKTGSVFSSATGESLIQPSFTQHLQVDFSGRPATARQLVLTFAQADIRSFRAAEQRAVSMLSALGFRFAISGLTDLDMNFEAMARAGFGFVKLDASVMIDGLPHPGGKIPASDVCRFLADQGFGLIVEGIDSEEMLARVFGFGVLLGQGALFGGRRPVKADIVAKPSHAAA